MAPLRRDRLAAVRPCAPVVTAHSGDVEGGIGVHVVRRVQG